MVKIANALEVPLAQLLAGIGPAAPTDPPDGEGKPVA
jgi:hypothetical protein